MLFSRLCAYSTYIVFCTYNRWWCLCVLSPFNARVGHYSGRQTDQPQLLAREPVKTSLDARDSKESNENDKNIPSHLKLLKKIHICAFAVLNFLRK